MFAQEHPEQPQPEDGSVDQAMALPQAEEGFDPAKFVFDQKFHSTKDLWAQKAVRKPDPFDEFVVENFEQETFV